MSIVAELESADQLLAAAIRDAETIIAKAEANADRQDLLDEHVPDFEADLAAYFRALAGRVTGTVAKLEAWRFDPDTSVDWTVEDDELTTVLVRWFTTLGDAAFAALNEDLGIDLRFDLQARSTDSIRDFIAAEVRGINDTSRERLRTLVQGAVADGTSVDDFESQLHDLVAGWASTPADGTDSRAHMIALTEVAQATNLSTTAGYRESGLVDSVNVYDGADCGWTSHDDPDLADGSVRTLDEADEYPIAHPHCVAPETIIAPIGRPTAAYRATWSGPLVDITTAAGSRLSVGPYHPVLTGRGWVAAQLLNVGDHVIRSLVHGARSPLAGHGDLDDRQASAEDVFGALRQIARHSQVVATASDFHGDGRFIQQEVEVVGTDRLLLDEGQAAVREQAGQLGFVPADTETARLSGGRATYPTLEWLRGASPRIVGRRHVPGVGVLVADRDPALAEPIAQRRVGDARSLGDVLGRLAGQVALDEIVEVRYRESVGGHVYDFETSEGAYFASSILVHNCQRAFGPVVAQ